MKVGVARQVLPVVRYCIPRIRVIRAEGLQGEREGKFKRYVESRPGNVGRGSEEAR